MCPKARKLCSLSHVRTTSVQARTLSPLSIFCEYFPCNTVFNVISFRVGRYFQYAILSIFLKTFSPGKLHKMHFGFIFKISHG